MAIVAAAVAGIVAGGCRGWPQTVQEKRAYGDARLKAMGERLAGLQNFSFVADEYHLRSDPGAPGAPGDPGQPGQPADPGAAGRELRKRDLVREVVIRRPDAAWFGSRGDRGDQVWYSASTLTLASSGDETWAVAQLPGSLDEAVPDVGDRIELLRPLTDLLSGALWDAALAPERAGGWVSIETIGKRNCDRVVYSQKSVDWQLWIEEGASALPCQLMLVYKLEPGPARSTLVFRDWNLAADAPAGLFQPAIPAGFRPLGQLERGPARAVPVAPVPSVAPAAPAAADSGR
jgi:hypothetical protein